MKKLLTILLTIFTVASFLTCQKDQPTGPDSKKDESVEWVSVPGGTFQMGNTFGYGYSDEKPVHTVTLSSFKMSKYEVTNRQYAAFLNAYGNDKVKSGEHAGQTMIYEYNWGVKKMGGTWQPATGKEKHPVIGVTWYGAYEFCRFYGWRLPTEAEWEYAARSGGKSEKWAGTSDLGRLFEYAWYSENSGASTHAVGERKPNGLGLYDMSGNVREWCNDWYSNIYYGASPLNNPPGPDKGTLRVLRGGSWIINESYLRCSYRGFLFNPYYRFIDLGFRLVR